MTKTFVIVKVVIVSKGQNVLILKRGMTAPRRPGTWDLPGGFVDIGEDLLAAVVRETYEESGITLKQAELVYADSHYEKEYDASGTRVLYVAHVPEEKSRISWEHDEAKWVPVQDLPDWITAGHQKDAVAYFCAHDLAYSQPTQLLG